MPILSGAGCEQSSQGRPFYAFQTIHRMVWIAFGDRLQTHASQTSVC